MLNITNAYTSSALNTESLDLRRVSRSDTAVDDKISTFKTDCQLDEK